MTVTTLDTSHCFNSRVMTNSAQTTIWVFLSLWITELLHPILFIAYCMYFFLCYLWTVLSEKTSISLSFNSLKIFSDFLCTENYCTSCSGGSREGACPPYFWTKLSLKGWKKNFSDKAYPYLRVWMTPPPPLSEGLDPPLCCTYQHLEVFLLI